MQPLSRTSKEAKTFAAAVRDISDGATIGLGGFAGVGAPFNLIAALLKQGAKRLTIVTNGTGSGQAQRPPDTNSLVENGQVRKVICAFTASPRPSDVIPFTKYYEAGEIEGELVPQGTLAERMRAAGAGIPAFYTPAAVGTELAEGRETRDFNGREYLLEHALPLDHAFIRAWRADAFGNLQFRLSQRNFNPVMAMAARTVLVEVEEPVLPIGEIDPDQVHLSGIFVHRVVHIPPAPEGIWPTRRPERRR
jgi:3-oxoacid CoA-transferase A subunit